MEPHASKPANRQGTKRRMMSQAIEEQNLSGFVATSNDGRTRRGVSRSCGRVREYRLEGNLVKRAGKKGNGESAGVGLSVGCRQWRKVGFGERLRYKQRSDHGWAHAGAFAGILEWSVPAM